MCLSRLRRAALALLVAALTSGVFVGPAQGAAEPPAGRITSAVQNTFTHRLQVTGWAYDPRLPRASIRVRLYVDGEFVRSVRADRPSPRADRIFHLSGNHRFVTTIGPLPRAGHVRAETRGVRSAGPLHRLDVRAVHHHYPPPGDRLVYVARKYLGAPYAYGGASPTGFDCSGYTMYVYGHANVRRLVHSAEGQRRSMRHVRRSHARAGDLVFYMRGGSAFHVAVYAGHGRQYAASTPATGVRYQPIWATNIRFGTTWH